MSYAYFSININQALGFVVEFRSCAACNWVYKSANDCYVSQRVLTLIKTGE